MHYLLSVRSLYTRLYKTYGHRSNLKQTCDVMLLLHATRVNKISAISNRSKALNARNATDEAITHYNFVAVMLLSSLVFN